MHAAGVAVDPGRTRLAAVPALVPRTRLLLITDTSLALAGGSERFLRNLVAMLPADRYDITVVQLHHTGAGDPGGGPMATPAGAHLSVLDLPVQAIYGPSGWRALRALRALLRAGDFDIVQSQHEKSDLLNALLPRRRGRGRVHVSNRRDMGFKKSARLKSLFRLLNHRFDRVVAPAQAVLDALRHSEGLDASRTQCIANGVDTRAFHPGTAIQRQAVRATLGLPDDALVFGCVARLIPEKRHVDLVQAFAVLHAAVPAARLLLVGDGPCRAQIGAQIESLGLAGAVLLPGERSDTESLLPALDVGMLVSSSEGMPNAVLEMMACGLPVIATAVGGSQVLVGHLHTGLLVPPCRPDLLADAMATLAGDPVARLRMGHAGRARAENEFSLDAMVVAFERVWQRSGGVQ